MMRRPSYLERTLFIAFVMTVDALVALNVGWALFSAWSFLFLPILPILGISALVSFLAFVLLEDHLRSRG
jgi:hypothetical protein